MRKFININKKTVDFREIDKEFETTDDVIINIDTLGAYRLDYIIEIIKDFNKFPSKFSIARKLDKYTK